jgi:hypothetical protein
MNDRMMVKRYDDGACGPVAANDPDALMAAYGRAMRAEDLLAEVAAMARMNAAPEERRAA